MDTALYYPLLQGYSHLHRLVDWGSGPTLRLISDWSVELISVPNFPIRNGAKFRLTSSTLRACNALRPKLILLVLL